MTNYCCVFLFLAGFNFPIDKINYLCMCCFFSLASYQLEKARKSVYSG